MAVACPGLPAPMQLKMFPFKLEPWISVTSWIGAVHTLLGAIVLGWPRKSLAAIWCSASTDLLLLIHPVSGAVGPGVSSWLLGFRLVLPAPKYMAVCVPQQRAKHSGSQLGQIQ